MPNVQIINPFQHNAASISPQSATGQQQLLPGPISTAVATAPQQQPALGPVPFVQAAKRMSQLGNQYSAVPFGGQFNNVIPAYGFLSAPYFTIQAAGGTSAGAVVVTEDAPFNVVANVTILDRSGAPLMSLDGYSWFITQLYDGTSLYRLDGDTGFSFQNVQLTSGAGAGNFFFIMPFEMEFGQDGIGVLPNDNAQAAYQFNITFAASATIYTTPPTTLPTLQGGVELMGRMKPTPNDTVTGQANITVPPGLGIFKTWSLQSVTLSQGLNNIPITRVGNQWRVLVLIFRSATNNTRATAETDGTLSKTTPLFLKWDAATLRLENVTTARYKAWRQTGIGTLNGVVAIPFDVEGGLHLHGELAGYYNDYIPTQLGANMQLQITNNGPNAGKLTILLCDIVVPAGVNFYEVAAMAHAHPVVQAS